MNASTRRSCALALLLAPALTAQTRVDLTPYQTPLKNQGGRQTCIAFAATAALEARYKHAGIDLDLSEEFVNYMGKLAWLHPYWTDITTADTVENQMGWTGGGGGVGHAHNFTYWMRVPPESAMPYRSSEYSVPFPWGHSHWNSQRNVNTWNLDPANLPRSVLNQSAYYSATGVIDLPGALSRNTAAIEGKLANGFEVIWDFVTHSGMPAGPIWHPGTPNGGAHSMLIVGYDRTDPNPQNHYFLVKNSWGPTSQPGGYTWVGYDFVQTAGINACYINGVAPARTWPELRFLGRRNMSIDGHRGTLDIYHPPGASSHLWSDAYGVTTTDRRLGTFYDSAGNAHRVNGFISGDQMTFWLKSTNRNMPYDEQRETPTLGQQFVYRIVDGDGDELAGLFWNNAGSTPNPSIGGYARRPSSINGTSGYLAPVFDTAQGWAPTQWLGRWRMQYDGQTDDLFVEARDDSQLTTAQRATFAGLRCWRRRGLEPWTQFYARTDLAAGREFSFNTTDGSTYLIANTWMLAWERGVAAGTLWHGSFTAGGVYLVRLGNYRAGSIEYFGAGCGPAGVAPSLAASAPQGFPLLGEHVFFDVDSTAANAGLMLAFGLSRTMWGTTPLPLDLGIVGAPGCIGRVSLDRTWLYATDAAGHFRTNLWMTGREFLGVHIYSQAFVLQPGYNAFGVLATNAVDFVYGGN